jgi:putative hydrolase of the HAD superfamily
VTLPRCVVFDVDDTLYLERDYVRSGFEVVGGWARRELGIEDFGSRAWARFLAGERGSTFNSVLGETTGDVDPGTVAQLISVYREHQPRIALLHDARSFLKAIRATCSLAVLTDGPRTSQGAKMAALGLSDLVDLVILTDELGPGFEKPNTAAFELVEERTGVRGAGCVYIADNPAKDFMGPAQLGWRTVRVRRTGSLYEQHVSSADVDLEVCCLEVLRALCDVGRQ